MLETHRRGEDAESSWGDMMRRRMGRGEARLGVETSICLLAGVLAFGTLAWMQALHGDDVLAAGVGTGGSHLLRDGLLLLPLALAAALGALRSWRGLWRGAARIALLFSALLIPATAGHDALHAADEGTSAHASAAAGTGMPGMSGDGDGFVDTLLHGAADAALAVPVAFVLALGALALLFGRRDRAFLPTGRRRVLALVASTVAVAGVAVVVPVSVAESPPYAKFSMPLAIPQVLTGQNINIDIAETQEQILPGSTTRMWTYNSSFPGPIIRRPSGAPTNVTFTNNLPPSAGSLTVHHHGVQAPEGDDGQPSSYLIEPGASKTYNYPGIDNGVPERAAPQWYHDHRDMVTGRNVWMGMLGAFIYDDAFESSLDLPQGEFDVPLMITDRQFDADNQIPYVFNQAGVFGDVILVNGVPQPFHEVGDRRYRFRLYNSSNRRDYTFRLSNGQAMTQIGTDSGLLPAPVQRTSILLGPAERAEVVIDFAGRLNETIVLQNASADFGPGDRDDEVMQFRVTRDLTDDSSAPPAALRPVFETDAPVNTRIWNLDRTTGSGQWTINGKAFDPTRVDAQPVLGTTERWVFRNPTTLPHMAHVHLGDQKLVSRNGRPPAPHERVKDTWYVAPGDEVVVDIKFTDYAGKFIFHCHVLEHEDDSMMTQFQTVQPTAAPPAVPPAAPPPAAPGATPPPFAPSSPQVRPLPLSRTIRIVSSKRLRNILRRGLRFESAIPRQGANLRAELRVRGQRIAVERRTTLSRGRVRVTMKFSRSERARLARLLRGRKRVAAQLKVTSGDSRTARFTIFH